MVCVAGVLTLRGCSHCLQRFSRKILQHRIPGFSIYLDICVRDNGGYRPIAAIIFAITIFPALALAERITRLSELLTERKREKSRIAWSWRFFTLWTICVCWVGSEKKYLVIASVSAWGLGDAAAALVGKRFGRHYIEGRLVEGRKSLEGTLAMFIVSFVSVLVVLLAYGTVEWHGYIPIAAVTAAVCAVVELYTRGGMDTVTCPFAALAILIPLIRLWGG